MKDTSSQGVLGGFSNYNNNEHKNMNDASGASSTSSSNGFSSTAQPNNNASSISNNGVLNNNINMNINGIGGGEDMDLIGSASEFIKGKYTFLNYLMGDI
jgi:hypothetical protein